MEGHTCDTGTAQERANVGDSGAAAAVMKDTHPTVVPAVGRMVSGLRAPSAGQARPKGGTTAVLEPWPEDHPRGLTCCGCTLVIRRGPVGICPDCRRAVHNDSRRDECMKEHAGRQTYACLQCVYKAGEKAVQNRS
jgi:hypothetical protein